VRTLVISDLHLGNRTERDVLRRPEPVERLRAAAREVDRLVVLGDLAELVTRTPERSLATAERALCAIAGGLSAEQEVVLVPGNHDRPLIRGWARARGAALRVDEAVPPDASPALARVISWLRPARVRVNYPGVWLDDGVYATHGHYLDRHLIPHAPVGLPRRGDLAPHAYPWDYEHHRFRARRRQDGRAGPLAGAIRLTARAANPAVPRLLMQAGLSPLTAAAVDIQMRHAALPALRAVLRRLGVEAETVIFGHVHRRGPLPADDPADWAAAGGPRILNSGSWLYERMLIDRARAPHPYWPGGAIRLEPGRAPETVGLLDDLSHDELWTPGR
jgi:UDP-2,3-diacylglucosamine pyrophosphatase LpxH